MDHTLSISLIVFTCKKPKLLHSKLDLELIFLHFFLEGLSPWGWLWWKSLTDYRLRFQGFSEHFEIKNCVKQKVLRFEFCGRSLWWKKLRIVTLNFSHRSEPLQTLNDTNNNDAKIIKYPQSYFGEDHIYETNQIPFFWKSSDWVKSFCISLRWQTIGRSDTNADLPP